MKRQAKNDFFFLKAGPAWCSQCKCRKDRATGKYIPAADGLRRRWVCADCLKRMNHDVYH